MACSSCGQTTNVVQPVQRPINLSTTSTIKFGGNKGFGKPRIVR